MIKIIAFLFINMWAMNYAIGASGYEYRKKKKPNQEIQLAKIAVKQ